MFSEELFKWCKKSFDNGFKKEQIILELKKQNYTDEHINSFFKEYNERFSKKKTKYYLGIIITLIITLVIWFFTMPPIEKDINTNQIIENYEKTTTFEDFILIDEYNSNNLVDAEIINNKLLRVLADFEKNCVDFYLMRTISDYSFYLEYDSVEYGREYCSTETFVDLENTDILSFFAYDENGKLFYIRGENNYEMPSDTFQYPVIDEFGEITPNYEFPDNTEKIDKYYSRNINGINYEVIFEEVHAENIIHKLSVNGKTLSDPFHNIKILGELNNIPLFLVSSGENIEKTTLVIVSLK
jgi:hypothetical protein